MRSQHNTVPSTPRAALGRVLLACAAGAALSAPAAAINTTIDWLDMSPVPFGTPVPNNTNYFHPGLGNVNITYSMAPGIFTHARGTHPAFQNGTVTDVNNDTYSWSAHEYFGATNLNPAPMLGDPWRITYTFTGTVPANQIYLGISGLGRTDNSGGIESTATVNQNGTFLGDWISGENWGATDFIPGAGTFTLRNSQTGPGGLDPWWNTELAVVRIGDAVSSLTVDFWQLPGDGLAVNIGHAVPAPGALSVLGLGALIGFRRRR